MTTQITIFFFSSCLYIVFRLHGNTSSNPTTRLLKTIEHAGQLCIMDNILSCVCSQIYRSTRDSELWRYLVTVQAIGREKKNLRESGTKLTVKYKRTSSFFFFLLFVLSTDRRYFVRFLIMASRYKRRSHNDNDGTLRRRHSNGGVVRTTRMCLVCIP